MAIDPDLTPDNDEPAPTPASDREVSRGSESAELASPADEAAAAASRELSEEVPVPIAMWPSEIDERARVVEAIEAEEVQPVRGPQPRTDDELSR